MKMPKRANIFSMGRENTFILNFDNDHEMSILSGSKVMSFLADATTKLLTPCTGRPVLAHAPAWWEPGAERCSCAGCS